MDFSNVIQALRQEGFSVVKTKEWSDGDCYVEISRVNDEDFKKAAEICESYGVRVAQRFAWR